MSEIKKPTQKQIQIILEKKLIGEIQVAERKLSKMKLFLSKLQIGKVEVKASNYKGNQWYLEAGDKVLDESIWDFVDKTKVVEIVKSRF